jgi:hypothetical protein
VSFEVAGRWDDMSEEQRRQWTAWARELKGWTEDEEDDE